MKRLTKKTKNSLRKVRHTRVRAKMTGTAEAPRLSVFRSLRSITAQLVDDTKGATICYANTKETAKEKVENMTGKMADGFLVGKLIAERAKAKGIKRAVFDRGGYMYHGRVKAVAEGARAGGLEL